MKRAQVRDAVHSQMFYFRKSVVPEDDEDEDTEEREGEGAQATPTLRSHDHEYTLMSIDTIVNGKV